MYHLLEKKKNVSQTYCDRGTLFAGHMEEDGVLPSNDVRHSITIICHRSKASTSTDTFRIFGKVHLVSLTMRSLGSAEAPRL